MRDHKYRVWDKNLKSMITFESGNDYLLCFGDEKPMIQMFSNGGEFIEAYPAENIMEYVGLKDKNNKEICEGDIIDGSKYSDESSPSVVVFEDGAFRRKYKNWGDSLSKPIITNVELSILDDVVIGNIYENPELFNNN